MLSEKYTYNKKAKVLFKQQNGPYQCNIIKQNMILL